MNWFTATVLIIGLLFWCSRKSGPVKRKPAAVPRPSQKRDGEQIAEVASSDDPKKMTALLERVSDPVDRHQLLTALVQHFYRRRSEAPARKQLYDHGNAYMSEFEKMAPALNISAKDGQIQAPVLKCLAIALEEDQRFEESIQICRLALAWDLDDGTKTGYAGRIRRLEKKQAAH